ncbi:molecular chaperone Hsp33 [Limimonas halophila]|uniref:Molecular chaperone Hsp33 n=1 Tax=Limimonas halophila TaxID=1082479 RepID=A0A1G7TZB1_9PROT|nr:Hsp33 family molecular chaperone HslO [Limimonas halophila]SDG40603.1 molecular chaperone Hsp33 [Limimonas halophila]
MSDVSAAGGAAPAGDDLALPFTLESSGVRGRLVRTGPVVDAILTRHAYPAPVARLLGEMLALAGLMASMLKYDGIFTLQASGDGPVSMVVVDYMSDGAVRGYASVDEDRLPADDAAMVEENADVLKLMGQGHLAFTLDQEGTAERQQGIVELNGRTLAGCLQHYFQQSEQVASSLRLGAARVRANDGTTGWRAGGLMMQRLPEEAGARDLAGVDAEDDWRRAVVLMASATREELCDPDLSANQLLYRLFHEEGVRVYQQHTLADSCRCSREKVANVLTKMDPGEVESMKLSDGSIEVTCQFCNRMYHFTDAQVGELAANAG